MTLQLRCISLFSKRSERRDVVLKLGTLNIVTGASKTGKSALLDIVDYCWGRGECTVAEGEIRRSVSWFSIYLDRDGEGILIARRNPGPAGKASDDVFFARGVDAVPADDSVFHKNITLDGLKAQLSTLLRISENIHVPPPEATRAPLEANARHAILFCLQAQDEIASRRFLFHRQGEQFFPAAIRDTLPYFLGALDEEHLITLARYNDARVRLRRLEREQQVARSVSKDVLESSQALLREARRVGLLPQGAEPSTDEEVVRLLTAAVEIKSFEFSAIESISDGLAELEERRRAIRESLQELREEIADVGRLNREATEFELEAKEQRARLTSIELLRRPDDPSADVCPLCDSILHVPVPQVAEIRGALAGVSRRLEAVTRDAPRLQNRLIQLEGRKTALEGEFRDVQRDIAQRIQDSERMRIQREQYAEQARVMGRITYFLENAHISSGDSEFSEELDKLKTQISEYERLLDSDNLQQRLDTALSLVNLEITEVARRLDLEHGANSLRLDLRSLTVVADTSDGPLQLSQMGSGENWVGYHIAAHLGLHKLFRRRDRPVPAFLMLDQPSQAHYPPERDANGRIDGLEDEDQAAVQRLFELLARYPQTTHTPLQIIVADHVELLQPWFRDAIAERWRDGIKLVPLDWLKE